MKRTVESSGLTDIGLKREHNEDRILVSDELGLYAVADGMGGHAAGEVASRTAMTTLEDFVSRFQTDDNITWPFGLQPDYSQNENVLNTATLLANQSVCNLAQENSMYGGMGTTIAAIYVPEERAHIAHVGDSRVYLFRDGKLECLTEDHSWVNEQVQRKILSKKEAREHRWRNVITRALGNREPVEVDLKSVDIEAGDILIACSDGLTGMIDDAVIEEIVKEHQNDLGACCDELVRRSNEEGGLDNVSVVLVKIES